MNRKKRATFLALALVPFLLLCVGREATAQTIEKFCTAASIQGAYGFRGQGTDTTRGPLGGPTAHVGRFVADGAGGLDGVITQVVNGTLFPSAAVTGVLTVEPDCTGTLTSPEAGTAEFVIVNDGEEIWFLLTIQTPPDQLDAVLVIIAKRQ